MNQVGWGGAGVRGGGAGTKREVVREKGGEGIRGLGPRGKW